ncbi:MAG: hypothetical protein OQK82_06835 [Candidatus Pacearchaeota archaeon]|nr:hypothetical protein [Candidatus Pacearchaeota archaeon]
MVKKKQSRKQVKKDSLRFDSVRLGIAGGIISSFYMMLTTIIGILGEFGLHNSMVKEMYGMMGYSTCWLGVFLGGLYGFLDGFFMLWVFAIIYNFLIDRS